MLNDRRVKNHKLFEGVSPSSYDLATCVRHPKNAHGVSKSHFLGVHQISTPGNLLTFKSFGIAHLPIVNRGKEAQMRCAVLRDLPRLLNVSKNLLQF